MWLAFLCLAYLEKHNNPQFPKLFQMAGFPLKKIIIIFIYFGYTGSQLWLLGPLVGACGMMVPD